MTSLVLRPLRCVVAGSIALEAPPPDVLERIRRDLSFTHPDFLRALRSSKPTAGLEERYHATIETPESLIVPRGAISVVQRVLEERGYRPEWVDQREFGSQLVTGNGVFLHFGSRPPELREYQAEGVTEVLKRVQGLIVLPPGGGKTTLGAEIIRAVGRTALVVVHTEELVDQWCETIERRLGIAAGRMRDGSIERFGSVVVAVVNTLSAALHAMPGLARCWGTVIVDEAHMSPASTFQSALMVLPARYRVGLTATPDRDDGLGPLVDWSFGPRLVERTARELIDRGYLTAPRVQPVRTEFSFDVESVAKSKRMAALAEAIVTDVERNELVASLVCTEAVAGEQVLVLTNSIAHCALLSALLEQALVAHAVVTGKTPKKTRKADVTRFREGNLRVLLATSLADHGVDWPQLSRVVLALPGRSGNRTIQRLGRLMRNYPGKQPVLIDVVDTEVPTLVRRWQERRRVYTKTNLDVQELA